jgi:hypothetical protein
MKKLFSVTSQHPAMLKSSIRQRLAAAGCHVHKPFLAEKSRTHAVI